MKKALIPEACGNDDEPLEVGGIKSQAKLYLMDVISECILKTTNLNSILGKVKLLITYT
jgi:hypothetical protein